MDDPHALYFVVARWALIPFMGLVACQVDASLGPARAHPSATQAWSAVPGVSSTSSSPPGSEASSDTAGGVSDGGSGRSTTDAAETGEASDAGTTDVGSGSTGPPVIPDPLPADDGFDHAAPCEFLSGWSLLHLDVGDPQPYAVCDADTTRPGSLTIIPVPSGWYGAYRGTFVYRLTDGDFFIETSARVSSATDPDAPPSQPYNSGGLMVRSPESNTGIENWVLASLGTHDGRTGVEGKLTRNSVSILQTVPLDSSDGLLRICRVAGQAIIAHRGPEDDAFNVTHVFGQTGLPDVVQVGLEATAWNSLGSEPDLDEEPDVIAEFRYFRLSPVTSAQDCLAD